MNWKCKHTAGLLISLFTMSVSAVTINLTGTVIESVSDVIVTNNDIITSEDVRVISNMNYSVVVSGVNTHNEVTISIVAI